MSNDIVYEFTCTICGGPGRATQDHAKYCSQPCKNRAKYLRQKASGASQAKAQRKKERGYHQTPEYKARHSEYRKLKRAEGAPWAKDANNRLRARKAGVEYESINHYEIFERDDWTCQICREPVDRELPHPNPLCASLDHIVPLEDGGPHLRANVQLAHLSCNSKKSNDKEQQEGRRA